MKSILFIVAAIVGAASSCRSNESTFDTTFVLLETCNDSVDVSGLWVNALYCLSQNIFLAEGVWVDSEGHGLKLVAIEKTTNRIIFDGLEDDAGGNSWTFYRLRAAGKLVVLGVVGTEWSSSEFCLVFDTLHPDCTVAGRFDIEDYREPLSEADHKFPVEQIGVQHSDSVVTFKFLRKVIFRPYDGYNVADSVVYSLDFRTDSLVVIFPPD